MGMSVSSESSSSATLKSINVSNTKRKRPRKMEESDDDFEEYEPPNDSDGDFKLSDDDESGFAENRRVLRKKVKKSYKERPASTTNTNEDAESEYNLSDDLEIDEEDDMDDSDY